MPVVVAPTLDPVVLADVGVDPMFLLEAVVVVVVLGFYAGFESCVLGLFKFLTVVGVVLIPDVLAAYCIGVVFVLVAVFVLLVVEGFLSFLGVFNIDYLFD